MARPKEFQREEALDKAVEVFWTRGYEATSMSDLQRAMGIGRQSLYDTFGGKKALFTASLERYLGFVDTRIARSLGGDDGLAAVQAYLRDTARDLPTSADRRACFLFNSCVELAPHDVGVAAQTERGLASLRAGIAGALTRAQAQGTVASDADVDALAVFLTTQIGGLVVMAKAGAPAEDLRVAAELALSVIS